MISSESSRGGRVHLYNRGGCPPILSRQGGCPPVFFNESRDGCVHLFIPVSLHFQGRSLQLGEYYTW